MPPILLIAFANLDRISFWEKVIPRDRSVWLVVDGGRTAEEQKECETVVSAYQQLLGDRIEKVLLRDQNLGCGSGPFEAISWAFQFTEKLIILEDDCIPDQSFFLFCDELLERYQNEERVMTISGSRFFAEPTSKESYHFSKFQHIWGWATWKRAWKKMDYSMRQYADKVNTDWLGAYLGSKVAGSYWRRNFQTILDGRTDVWDYQWQLACWANKGLCIQPRENLISNIGVDSGGTHSNQSTHHRSISRGVMEFPLTHPKEFEPDTNYDKKIYNNFFTEGFFTDWLKYIIKG